MGDFNAVIGGGKEGKYIGHYGLGCHNQTGEKLVEFCRRKEMCITNARFCHNKRRRYTWTMPGDIRRQIDYIITKCRYWNSVTNSKAYPGAVIDPDHSLVAANLRIKLKKVLKAKRRRQWNLDKVKDVMCEMEYRCETNLLIEKGKQKHIDLEERWETFRNSVKDAATKTLGFQISKNVRKLWITQEMIEKMDERRRWKNVNTEEGKKR